MANKVEQQMIFCPREQKTTLFYRNAKSRNWIMHIILVLVTFLSHLCGDEVIRKWFNKIFGFLSHLCGDEDLFALVATGAFG